MKNQIDRHFRLWLLLAPLGLSLIGIGLCIAMDTAVRRAEGVPFWTWFGWGTFGLVIVNTGISLVGDAVKHRTLFELKKENNPS